MSTPERHEIPQADITKTLWRKYRKPPNTAAAAAIPSAPSTHSCALARSRVSVM